MPKTEDFTLKFNIHWERSKSTIRSINNESEVNKRLNINTSLLLDRSMQNSKVLYAYIIIDEDQ